MKDLIPNRVRRFALKKLALFGWDDENGGFLEASPQQPLFATVAEGHTLAPLWNRNSAD